MAFWIAAIRHMHRLMVVEAARFVIANRLMPPDDTSVDESAKFPPPYGKGKPTREAFSPRKCKPRSAGPCPQDYSDGHRKSQEVLNHAAFSY